MRDMNTRELVEVELKTRQTGWWGSDYIPMPFSKTRVNERILEQEQICFANACDLKAEYKTAPDSEVIKSRLYVITTERDCPRFIPWRQGRSPKEHDEMQLLQEVERRTERWQKQQEALYETRHQEELREQRKSRITSAIIAIIGVIASIFAAYLTAK
jgi:hypothetical protein